MACTYEDYNKEYPQPELNSAITRGRFSGKVAVVVGGSSGIGLATVERFCNDGAAAAIFARTKERGEEFASHLRSVGKNVKFYQVDVTDKERCVEAARQVAEDNEGKINFLVNCQDTGEFFSDNPYRPEFLREEFNVTILGTANIVQACYPYMEKHGPQCAIVNISSVWGRVAPPNPVFAHSTSKAGLIMLTKCMALDLSRCGIRVNSVCPGPVWTPPTKMVLGENAKEFAEKVLMTPRRVIDASGVASVVTFLCSDDAMFIDGADIPVDGGYLAMGPEGMGQQ